MILMVISEPSAVVQYSPVENLFESLLSHLIWLVSTSIGCFSKQKKSLHS